MRSGRQRTVWFLAVLVAVLCPAIAQAVQFPAGRIGVGLVVPDTDPPTITSSLTASGTEDVVFGTYTITATKSPTSFNATGLPTGLSVDTGTGEITGTPTTAGVSNVTISATNAFGTGQDTLVITINAAASSPGREASAHYMTVFRTANATTDVDRRLTYYDAMGLHIEAFEPASDQDVTEILRLHDRIVSQGFNARVALAPGYHQSTNDTRVGNLLTTLQGASYAAGRWFHDGKYVMTSYEGSTYQNDRIPTFETQSGLSTGEILFLPHVHTKGGVTDATAWEGVGYFLDANSADDYERLIGHPDWDRADGFSEWNPWQDLNRGINAIGWLAAEAAEDGLLARPSVTLSYRGLPHKGNWLTVENLGYWKGYAMIQAALNADAPFLNIVTGDDMSEASYIEDWITGKPALWKEHWNVGDNGPILDHSGFREAGARWIEWYETGTAPAISTDELYYFYRPHNRDAIAYDSLATADKTEFQLWIPSFQNTNPSYRSNIYRARSETDYQAHTDGVHVCVRLTETSDVWIKFASDASYTLVGDDLPAGEHFLTIWGTNDHGTDNGSPELNYKNYLPAGVHATDGTTGRKYTRWGQPSGNTATTYRSFAVGTISSPGADRGAPSFKITRTAGGATVIEGQGKLPITNHSWALGDGIARKLVNADTVLSPPISP